jgi:hypothetical protein
VADGALLEICHDDDDEAQDLQGEEPDHGSRA